MCNYSLTVTAYLAQAKSELHQTLLIKKQSGSLETAQWQVKTTRTTQYFTLYCTPLSTATNVSLLKSKA